MINAPANPVSREKMDSVFVLEMKCLELANVSAKMEWLEID